METTTRASTVIKSMPTKAGKGIQRDANHSIAVEIVMI